MSIVARVKAKFQPPPLGPEPLPQKTSGIVVDVRPNPDQPIGVAPVNKRPLVRADEATLAAVDRKYKKGTREWYQAAYLLIEFDTGRKAQVEKAADVVMRGKNNYLDIEKATKVPWYVVGMVHNMECNCNFRGVLHNGQAIVGTGRKTTIVPKGKGPFATWRAAALDAIATQPLWNQKAFTIGDVLKMVEAFNGVGYLKYHKAENSPYVWACSNINDGHGKYTSDGKWSALAATDNQVGAATLLRQLEINGQVELEWA